MNNTRVVPFRRAFAVILSVFMGLAVSVTAHAEVPPPEHKIKAAFIYNFARFVEWPTAPAGTPIRVGVVGTDRVVSVVREAIDGRLVGDRPVVVEKVTREEDGKNHEVLYVSGNNAAAARRFVSPATGRPVLTITEVDRFLSVGSLVNFFIAEDSVRFAVNADELDKAAIKVSSQMLQFAAIVRADKP